MESVEGSVLNTGEITLVLSGFHKGNLDERGDIGDNPKYSEDMKADLERCPR